MIDKIRTKDMKMYFYNGDARRIATWGAVGAAGFIAYQMMHTTVRRNIDPSSELQDPTECLNMDPAIRDAFINLQEFRACNDWLFRTALRNCDSLLFKEKTILDKTIVPNENDKVIAFTYFRVACNKLKMFQASVQEKMGNYHALVVQQLTTIIFRRANEHLIFIINSCSQSKSIDMLSKARADLSSNQIRTEAECLKKWETLKGKAETRIKNKQKSTTAEPSRY